MWVNYILVMAIFLRIRKKVYSVVFMEFLIRLKWTASFPFNFFCKLCSFNALSFIYFD